jgi:peroxiredoxin
VLVVSTDPLEKLKEWAAQQKLSYPLLSDAERKVSQLYGVLAAASGRAQRTTFVIDREGRIQHLEQGPSAINPEGALGACKRVTQRPR